MTLPIRQSEDFDKDFDLQFNWYLARGGPSVAEKYLAAVNLTLELLAQQPGLGRKRRFQHQDLQGIYSRRVEPPFNSQLIFYRQFPEGLVAERILHGARDLPRRLRQPPGVG
jgi:toxin ParE1/3/4